MKISGISIILTIFAFRTNTGKSQSNNKYLPSFRIHAEESEHYDGVKSHKDNESSNLVAFLVENVKRIFDDLHETTSIINRSLEKLDTLSEVQTQTLNHDDEDKVENINVVKSSEATKYNTKIAGKVDKAYNKVTKRRKLNDATTINYQIHLSRDLMYHKTSSLAEQLTNRAENNTNCNLLYETQLERFAHRRRSCIACDNIMAKDCSDPKNKLVPSILCEREDDLCYSMHTPFGIIDRGCFNVNYNISTYVCSCNLCNYISISEMPYIFSSKRDWVDNVVELSRTIRFRKSVFKDMSCLRCEVNVTTERGDMLDSANCLEGNVGLLPREICGEDEICVVKSIRSQGYIWRGCAKSPLYNYWWKYCDSDLCNYDSITSIYDFL
ncbi:uncharacterized protein LOC114250760 [Bombyx mandarina]|uniref:Uncharacterized protein LOC114250760 n=1 Tax=Bombyx mandarina TaxID=7092 RepID=A0A6J2KK60_BOMMA|nr:uncharacterized protein LOC114250760 [Bombyx mandarina]